MKIPYLTLEAMLLSFQMDVNNLALQPDGQEHVCSVSCRW